MEKKRSLSQGSDTRLQWEKDIVDMEPRKDKTRKVDYRMLKDNPDESRRSKRLMQMSYTERVAFEKEENKRLKAFVQRENRKERKKR